MARPLVLRPGPDRRLPWLVRLVPVRWRRSTPVPPTPSLGFEPSPVDEAAARRDIERLARGLAPDGVDECTGHVMDNLINSWADRWVSQVYTDYLAFEAVRQPYATAARADLVRYEILSGAAGQHLDAMWIALQAAASRLLAAEPAPSGPRDPDGADTR